MPFYPKPKFSKLANIRFDVKNAESILYHDDQASLEASITARMPDPTLGFNDRSVGSDALNVLRQFLSNTVSHACGARVMLFLKRHSNENKNDYAELITRLQSHHIFIQTSASTTPSGGNNMQAVYDVVTRTNGFYIFSGDPNIGEFMANGLNSIFDLSLIYSSNPDNVSSGGSMGLCPIPIPNNLSKNNLGYNAYILINVQNDPAQLKNFVSATVKLLDRNGVVVVRLPFTQANLNPLSTFCSLEFNLPTAESSYRVVLDSDYTGNGLNALEIRIYAYAHESTWPQYLNINVCEY